MLARYKTVNEFAQAEIVEKKSRFIATVKPVTNESEAQGLIEEIRKKYWDASHNVFAYQIGERNELQRMSDDGEPGGTAGMPVLDVLKGEDIKNTAIVVTRYFGGILLGTGGLVRAYGRAAKEGIRKAGLIEKILYQTVHICVDYGLSGKLQYETLQFGAVIHETVYTDVVSYIVLVESGLSGKYLGIVQEATNGVARTEISHCVYGAIIDGMLKLY